MLSRIPIAWRLALGASLPVLLFVAFCVWLWLALADVGASLGTRLAVDSDFALQAKDLQHNVVQVQQFLSDVSATRALDGLGDGFDQAKGHRDQFLAGLERFRAHLTERGATEQLLALDAVRGDFDRYYANGVLMAQGYVAGGPTQGNPMMAAFDQSSLALQTRLARFVEAQVGQMMAESAQAVRQTDAVRQSAVLLCAVSGALVLLLSGLLARSILRPLNSAVAVVQQVTQGDLTTTIDIPGDDEISRLLLSLRQMQQHLQEIFQGVLDNAHALDDASVAIAGGNAQLAARTEAQASALAQITIAMKQIEATVQNNVDHVQKANQLAVDTARVAAQGGKVVGQFVDTMKEINRSSGRIGDIIGVIDAIAFQTNILALNAAVEAARAGEQGRGFAVVATEVRSLAGRSAGAAREIKQLIHASLERVEQGTLLVDQAGSTMNEVLESVNRMSDLMCDLDTSALTQINGVFQVSQAMAQIEQSTRHNAELAEQSTQAADGLKAQSGDMLLAMAAFRLA